MEHGQPLRFGTPDEHGFLPRAVLRDEVGHLSIADNVAADDPRVVIHDAHHHDPSYAFALSRLSSGEGAYAPMGVFRDVDRPVYDDMMADQLATASLASGTTRDDADALQKLILGNDTWTVEGSVA